MVTLGRYRHYKGGLYDVICVAHHHETRRKMVVYISCETGEWSVRPLQGTEADPDGWLTLVQGVPRFTKVTRVE